MAKKSKPEAAACAKAREEVSAKAKAAVKDRKSLNNLLELLGNLTELPPSSEGASAVQLARAVASLRCLVEAFQQFVAAGDLVSENI